MGDVGVTNAVGRGCAMWPDETVECGGGGGGYPVPIPMVWGWAVSVTPSTPVRRGRQTRGGPDLQQNELLKAVNQLIFIRLVRLWTQGARCGSRS